MFVVAGVGLETAVQDADKWAAAARQVAACAGDDFVAIRGFEWTSPRQGHSNVWCSADYTGYRATGDDTIGAFYEWLADARPTNAARVLAGFNHPGRETACFDGCAYVPAIDDRIVTLECFNRGDDYGDRYVHALDRGWHVGAIGVSDHHETDWGSPTLPRAGVLAPERALQAMLDEYVHYLIDGEGLSARSSIERVAWPTLRPMSQRQ